MNHHQETLKTIEKIKTQNKTPTLLLHSCCAPCSSYVLEFLSEFFKITISYYNPNIYPETEYKRRFDELLKFIKEFPLKNEVDVLQLPYDSREFYKITKGLEDEREGGERCFACYRLRMEKGASLALEGGFDYFTTALSISPHKNSSKINEIGFLLQEQYGVKFLPADFKKNNGFKRSIELSREYDLYRQDYCGCVFSKKSRE